MNRFDGMDMAITFLLGIVAGFVLILIRGHIHTQSKKREEIYRVVKKLESEYEVRHRGPLVFGQVRSKGISAAPVRRDRKQGVQESPVCDAEESREGHNCLQLNVTASTEDDRRLLLRISDL